MKKILTLLLSASIMFSLCACGGSDSDSDNDTVACPSCKEEQHSDAEFCSDCGAKMIEDATCNNCGAEVSRKAAFCSECGESLSGKISGYDFPTETEDTGYDYPEETQKPKDSGSAACLECANKGLDECAGHKCLACNGKGYTECHNNCQDGCSFCDGGYVACFGCDNGTIYYGKGSGGGPIIPTFENCPDCDAGYVTCTLCEGTGKFGTRTVGGFFGSEEKEIPEPCTHCMATGKTECLNCRGYGTIEIYGNTQ